MNRDAPYILAIIFLLLVVAFLVLTNTARAESFLYPPNQSYSNQMAPSLPAPGSLRWQLRTGFPPENMSAPHWYAFSTAFFDLLQLNPGAAEDLGRLPVERAPDLYQGLCERVRIERKFATQRRQQLFAIGIIQNAVKQAR